MLQEKEFSRLGNNAAIEVDFRLIASTNRDLRDEIVQGRFREDLFYRINVVDLHVPPLRERRQDIRLLAKTFFEEFCGREGKKLALSDGALKVLEQYDWPGNVRELRNIVERTVVLAKRRMVAADNLPAELSLRQVGAVGLEPVVPLKELELRAVRDALVKCAGNKSAAARQLGLSRKALYMKIREHHLA